MSFYVYQEKNESEGETWTVLIDSSHAKTVSRLREVLDQFAGRLGRHDVMPYTVSETVYDNLAQVNNDYRIDNGATYHRPVQRMAVCEDTVERLADQLQKPVLEDSDWTFMEECLCNLNVLKHTGKGIDELM